MVLVENLFKERQNGRIIINEYKLSIARGMALSIGVDVDEWIAEYWTP